MCLGAITLLRGYDFTLKAENLEKSGADGVEVAAGVLAAVTNPDESTVVAPEQDMKPFPLLWRLSEG